MNKKEIAEAFLKLASSGRVREAFDLYVHEDLKHHLLFIQGTRDAFMEAMEENARQFPDKEYTTVHARASSHHCSITFRN